MKKIVSTPKVVERVVEKVTVNEEVIVDQDGGAITLLGKLVYVQCASYAYSGILSGVNGNSYELTDAVVVYETGAWTDKKWKVSEKLPTKTLVIFDKFCEAMFAVER